MSLSSLYIEVSQQLKDQIPELQFISLYNSQFSRMQDEMPIPFPAVLIEMASVVWTSNSQNHQDGNVVLAFHIGQQNFADFYQGSDNQDVAIATLDFLTTVHQALQGFSGSVFSGLNRVSTTTDIDHDHMIIHVMEYETRLRDISADPIRNREQVQPDPDLQVTGEFNDRVTGRPPEPPSPYRVES